MLKKCLLILFLVFAAMSAWTQQTVSGTVIDAQNVPVPGVSVVIKDIVLKAKGEKLKASELRIEAR